MPKILYGGSVTEKNARAFVEKGDVDGFLVGRTSLDIKKSIELLKKI
jgi:triosephosphate isomerase